MSRKRGRPKLDRPKHDYGTPELIKHRITMAPKDATLSTTPLDVCRSRGIISDEAYSAAICFAGLRKLVFGKAHPPAIDLTAVSRGGLPDDRVSAEDEADYREAYAALKCRGLKALDAVENLVVHERWPDWLFRQRGAHTSALQKHFGLGVAALLGWYRSRRRRAA